MQDYLISKDGFKFKQILSEGYKLKEIPVVLSKKTMASGRIRVVYAQYSSTTIKIKFGNMSGEDVRNYFSKFVDGEYTYWNNTEYKTANFIVTKPEMSLISQNNGENWKEYTITLEKSSEV